MACRVARRLRERRSKGVDIPRIITQNILSTFNVLSTPMETGQMDRQADVVVVGAGPVGLLTAIELALGGTRVLVLERLATASLEMKAGGLGPLGLEALERRGMAAAIAAAEARSFAAMAQTGADPRAKGSKYSGHFAGLALIRKDAQREPQRRSRPVDQPALEAMLADRAHVLAIDVRRACDITNFVQQAGAVDVE